MSNNMDVKAVNVIKGLIMDATRKANSGHPGGAMSSADFAYVLYKDYLNYDPDDAKWYNRDRFILSCGHESMLQYAILHLAGFLTKEDLENFRQLNSRTPGHPEVGETPGVEATTGPLGQGFAMSVGMAVAEACLSARLGDDVAGHFTYALASDGDLQEPIAVGAATLAGLWGLGKLVVFYDSNKVQLAGPTCNCDCTDFKKLFESVCWQVIEVDGHDQAAIRGAIEQGRNETRKPTLIIGHTVMAKGTATREGDHGTHGSPLSPEEIAASKEKMGLDPEQSFFVPEDVAEHFRSGQDQLRAKVDSWKKAKQAMLDKNDEKTEFWNLSTTARAELELDWPKFTPGESIATRKGWGACLNHIMGKLATLVGGSADLDPSNQTAKFRAELGEFCASSPTNRNLTFGVREFPMAAILNGMALHGGVIPFGATFLTFSDYCRNAIRMSALQKLPVLYVFTHDSFYVGEDGPTHQPVEHVSSLRLIPNLLVFRPCDATETAKCLDLALRQADRPSCLMLTRQGLPVIDPAQCPEIENGAEKGGYILKDCDGTPDLIIIGSGSETHLALGAQKELADRKVRVVNMPSMELFEQQSQEYKDRVLPPEVENRVAVEAGRGDLWYKYVGLKGAVLGMETFGLSAPAPLLAEKYGFTVENLVRVIKDKF